MIKSDFSLEKRLFSEGYEIIIGIDEAGRGPLAGPVVACATSLKATCHPERSEGSHAKASTTNLEGFFADAQNDKLFNLIRDSKTLSEKQREEIYNFILENFNVGVGICDHETIDRINILEASFLAMKKALADLERSDLKPAKVGPLKKIILLDGNKKIPNLSQEQKAIVNGDKYVKSISAASIIAKVTRDRMMRQMHEKYPQYQFDRHKGYGTKLHMDSLQKYGPCEIHRQSFRPVRKALLKG